MAKIQKLIFILLFSFFSFLFTNTSLAAVLYLEPAQGDYYPGDNLIVEMRLDTQDECINAMEANLSFSQDVLEAVDFSQGGSILILWVKEPIIEQESGLISLAGGIPGGYCGILPGDPGQSNLLGRMIFKIDELAQNQAEIIFLDSSQVLLNDGFGSQATLETSGATFNILAVKPETIPETTKDQWGGEITQDNIPPESFEIRIIQEPLTFQGKYFIAFSTTDKQTGLDYYEIAELDLLDRLFKKEKWQRATSPYLLKDQDLRSLIKVKAIDKAGNQRIETIELPFKFIWSDIIWGLIILIGLGTTFWLIKKIKK